MNPKGEEPRIIDEGARLLGRCARGDEEALSRLYDSYGGLLYSVAYMVLAGSDEAKDAVQETFVRAWTRAREFDPSRGSARSWLVLLVRSRCLDRIRRRTARDRYEGMAADGRGALNGPPREEPGRDVGLREAVRSALDELPIEQRRVIEEAFFGGLSHSEIAEKLGEPLGTVKTRMRLAARKLADRLREVWDHD